MTQANNKVVTHQENVAALHQFSKDVMEIWSGVDKIKPLFAPDLTDIEFKFFCGLGITLGANPFKREIWAVKYDKTKPAQIFCGRDFYRKKAQEQPDYNGHIAEAIYANDAFSVENGMPNHKFTLADRGELIAAYFMGWRKNVDKHYYHLVKFSEYNKSQSTWKSMPETMIKKVAEAQGLRMMFQGVFEGTYDESEVFDAGVDTNNVLGESIKMPVEIKAEDKGEDKNEDMPPEMNTGRFVQWSELQDNEIKESLKAIRDLAKEKKANIGDILLKNDIKDLTPANMSVEQYWSIYDYIKVM